MGMSKGEATRQAILDQAMMRASQYGLEGLTIGALAEDLGLSKSGLFAHFRSRETLLLHVLEHTSTHFVDFVVRPALRVPRGEPRLRALFERMLAWPPEGLLSGGCPILSAIFEFDDRPGPIRDLLIRLQRDWLDTITTIARTGASEGHFSGGLDPEQLAHELFGIDLAYHHASRLLRDPKATTRARIAFEALLQRAQTTPTP